MFGLDKADSDFFGGYATNLIFYRRNDIVHEFGKHH